MAETEQVITEQAATDAAAEKAAEDAAAEKAADFMFGKVEDAPEDIRTVDETEEEEEYQPDPKPIVEGEESEEIEATEEEFVEVEFEGQVIEAPPAIAEALMRNKDYSEKTQALSAQRKELDIRSENLNVLQSQADFANSIQDETVELWTANMELRNLQDYLETNARDMGAQDFQTVQMEIKKRERLIAEKSATLQQKYTDHQQATEQSKKELRAKSTEVLRQQIPGWNDDSERQLRDYALSRGISEQVYESVVDPLEKQILWESLQYRQLKENSGKAVKKVQTAPTIKPKARKTMPKDVGDKLNLRKKLKSKTRSATDKKHDMEEHIAKRFNI